MNRVVSLSGGTASAVAADRVIERYGMDTVLWFADTKWEDEDLYRFLDDLEDFWGMRIFKVTEGRTPLQVAEDRRIIPNQRRAPCSLVLKQQMFRAFLSELPKPVTVYLGLDWTEEHRMARPQKEYESIPGVSVDFPLLWPPMPTGTYYDQVMGWGIKPPRLYEMGFPHNNCGGRCVRQGVKEWLRLRHEFPERFEEVAVWEESQREQGDARANYAICRDQSEGKVRPLTLRQIESMANNDALPKRMVFQGDMFGCFCSY